MPVCLLFVIYDKTSEPLYTSDFKGYAFLSKSIKKTDLLYSIFLYYRVQIFRKEEECPPALAEAIKDGRVKLLEFLLQDTFSTVNSVDSETERSEESDDPDSTVNSELEVPQRNAQRFSSKQQNLSDSESESESESETSDNSYDSDDAANVEPEIPPQDRFVMREWNFGSVSSLIRGQTMPEHEHQLSEFFDGFINVTNRVIHYVLDTGMCVQVTEVNSWNFLHFAVAKNLGRLVKLFVKSEADINSKMVDGATPLHLTVFCKRESMMNYLLQQGADVNAKMSLKDFEDATPLHVALKNGAKPKVITRLLENGANVNADSKLGSILLLAIKANPQILSCVLRYRPDLNSTLNWQAFREALRQSSKKVIDLLLDYGFSSISDDNDSFFKAISVKDFQTVEKFVKEGVNVNYYCLNHMSEYYGMRPLHIAAENFLEEIMQLLMDHGANVRAKSTQGTPLFHAAKVLDLKAVEFLIVRGAPIRDDPLILHAAAEFKPPHLVPSEACGYISHNAPMLKFARRDKSLSAVVPIIRILMKNGACFCRADDSMKTLLMGHAYLGNRELVEILLKHHLFSMSEIKEAMMRAIIGNSRETLEFLLKSCGLPVVKVPFRCSLLDVALAEEAPTKKYPDIFPFLLNYEYLNLKLVAESGVFSYYETDDDFNPQETFLPITNYLIKHITKINAAKLKVNKNDSTFDLPAWVWCDTEFQSVCQLELKRLKNQKIGNSTVSFYDFLDANPVQISCYLRNDCIVDILKSGDHKKKFPVYSGIIDGLFLKGFYRSLLVKQGILMFNFLFAQSSEAIPRELKEYILDFLSNQHLLILNNVCKLQQKRNSVVSDSQ